MHETSLKDFLVPYEIQFRAKAKTNLVKSLNRIRNASNQTKTLHHY